MPLFSCICITNFCTTYIQCNTPLYHAILWNYKNKKSLLLQNVFYYPHSTGNTPIVKHNFLELFSFIWGKVCYQRATTISNTNLIEWESNVFVLAKQAKITHFKFENLRCCQVQKVLQRNIIWQHFLSVYRRRIVLAMSQFDI